MEISHGRNESPTPDGEFQQQTAFGATAESYSSAPMSGCAAGLYKGVRDHGEKREAPANHQIDFQEAAATDMLAACRMTLLDGIASSSNNGANCPSSSTVHGINACGLPLAAEVERSTSTIFPDRTSTAVKDTISPVSNVGSSQADADSRSSGSTRSYGAAHTELGIGTAIRFEAKSSSAGSTTNSRDLHVPTKLPTAAYSDWNNDLNRGLLCYNVDSM